MTISAMCDDCGKHDNPERMFKLTIPHSHELLHFCDKECLIEYINNEF